jgi:hypothetical protein
MTPMDKKQRLLSRGLQHILRWCGLNAVTAPIVTESDEPTQFGTCAYYRVDTGIVICVAACASQSPTALGFKGRAWSYPGHTVDRTPYGVLCHELGHHVDFAEGNRPGRGGCWRWQELTGEKPISGYAENPNEWFAEMFRLFVTNPDLLRELRPKTYAQMIARWPKRAEQRLWRDVLAEAPRQAKVIDGKLAVARKQQVRDDLRRSQMTLT